MVQTKSLQTLQILPKIGHIKTVLPENNQRKPSLPKPITKYVTKLNSNSYKIRPLT